MNCQKTQAWLVAHSLAGDLTDFPEISHHLRHCKDCDRLANRLMTLERELQSLGRMPIPEEIEMRVWPRVAIHLMQERERRVKGRRFRAVALPALATVCVLTLLVRTGSAPSVNGHEKEAVQILDARLDGRPACLSVVQSPQSEMTMVWMD